MSVTQFTWSKIELPDPAGYYGGLKDGRLLTMGRIRRALSDRFGQYVSASFDFTVSDWDRLMRGRLAGPTSKFLENSLVVARMISDANRRLLLTPRTVGIGLVRGWKQTSPLQFVFTCEDYLALYTGLGSQEKQIPKRRITREDFTDCPQDVLGKPVQWVYGRMSDEASTTAPPVLTGVTSEGGYVNEGYWAAGFGPLTSLASPVTGVTATTAAGGSLSLDVYNAEYGVIVTAVDSNGDESDPVPFFTNYPGIGRGSFDAAVPHDTVTSGNQTLNVSWTGSAGAVKYRVYLGFYYYGMRFTQFIEVNHPTTSCSFTANPPATQAPTVDNITPGANLVQFGQFWWWAVTAVMADGETGLSAEVLGRSGPYRRPQRIRWEAVTGALEYRVYRRGAGGTGNSGTWDRRWTVSAAQTYFDDDLLDTGVEYITGSPAAIGAVPMVPVGTQADSAGFSWYAFLAAGHACKGIDDLFIDGVAVDSTRYGIDVACPGKTGYSTYFPNTGTCQYFDKNGRRYTLVFLRGPDGTACANGEKTLRANVQGVERTGDSTGDLIVNGFEQYRHFLRNGILGDYQGGAWATTGPTWPNYLPALDVIDDDSFDRAFAISEDRIAGGYTDTAFVVGSGGELESTRTWIQRFNLSLDCYTGFSRKSQFFVRLIEVNLSALATAHHFQQLLDIYSGTFDVDDKVDWQENRVFYSHSRNYALGTWTTDNDQVENTTSIALSSPDNQAKESKTVEMWLTRNATMALDVAQRRLFRNQAPVRVVKWTTGLVGMNTELGDIVPLTHLEGPGTGGYLRQPIFVTGHELDPDRLRVSLEGLDVGALLGGGFILGDETTMAGTWTTANDGEKIYGYLCDEGTGEFSDGAEGKHLR